MPHCEGIMKRGSCHARIASCLFLVGASGCGGGISGQAAPSGGEAGIDGQSSPVDAADRDQGEASAVCDGAACDAAADASLPGVVASAQSPYWLTQTGGWLYWSNNLPPPTGASAQSSIMACDISACQATTVQLWTGLVGLAGLAIQARVAYWITGVGPAAADAPQILACPIGGCGGQPQSLSSFQDNVRAMAVDVTSIYWSTSAGDIKSCSLSGCASPTTLASGQNGASGIVSDGLNVYWANTNAGTIASCPVSGCQGNPHIVASNETFPVFVAAGNGGIVWIDAGTPMGGGNLPITGYAGGQVRKCDDAVCSAGVLTLATYAEWLGPGAIAVDGGTAFWTLEHVAGKDGEVASCPLGGCNGSPKIVASTNGPAPSVGLALDDANVYWTELSAGDIRSAPK